MNIAIYGAGSLGTIMGAFLSESDADVDLIDVNQAHVDKLNEEGAHVVGVWGQQIIVMRYMLLHLMKSINDTI